MAVNNRSAMANEFTPVNALSEQGALPRYESYLKKNATNGGPGPAASPIRRERPRRQPPVSLARRQVRNSDTADDPSIDIAGWSMQQCMAVYGCLEWVGAPFRGDSLLAYSR